MSRDCAGHWGDGKRTRRTWVLRSQSSKHSWEDGPRTIRLTASQFLIIEVSATKSYRILGASDERNRPKTGMDMSTQLDSVGDETRIQSPGSQFTAVPIGPHLGHQYLGRGLGEELSPQSTVVAGHLETKARGHISAASIEEQERERGGFTVFPALQCWEMVFAALGGS